MKGDFVKLAIIWIGFPCASVAAVMLTVSTLKRFPREPSPTSLRIQELMEENAALRAQNSRLIYSQNEMESSLDEVRERLDMSPYCNQQ
jgi:hypothetical protein